MSESAVSVTFLGGLGSIGRNCACIEDRGRMLLIDCGMMFPDSEMLGVDLVLPNFSFLRDNFHRIDGCVVTHGHDDHHGGLPYLLREYMVPLYGSALTLRLARNRIEEAGLLSQTTLNTVKDGECVRIGAFECEFIPVTHSVPQAMAVAVTTSQGVILHTGDFKLDEAPIDGRSTDLDRVMQLATSPGIRLLLSDSTNAERPGRSPSEASVRPGIESAFELAQDKRIIASCTASHLHRVRQIVETALERDRVVTTLGRSMKRNMGIAREMGLIELPEQSLIEATVKTGLDPARVCVLATGSQGEPLSALARASTDEARQLTLSNADLVLLSSRAVPGNESGVNRMINQLVLRGVEVVHSGSCHVHASGHASRDELQTMLEAARPEYFVPVHGEPRHLLAHARIAESVVSPNSIGICYDGDRVVLADAGMSIERQAVPSDYVFVDGLLTDVSHGVLRDRRILGTEGWVAVIVVLDLATRTCLVEPRLLSHGWIDDNAADALMPHGALVALDAVREILGDAQADLDDIRRKLRRSVGKWAMSSTDRRPMIAPIVLDY